MNAIAIKAEAIRTIAVPWKGFGISLYSIFSRIPARIMMAIVKPTAVAKPFTIPVKIPYSFCTLVNATPSTAQFVVIKGRNTPNALYLGDTSNPWKSLVVQSFTQTGSDRKIKKEIEDISINYEKLFDMLHPQRFKYKNGDSGRYHIGFIAQDVEMAIIESDLTNDDFAGLCISDPENSSSSSYTLRYEEFIALNTSEIQKLKSRVSELEKQIKEIKSKVIEAKKCLTIANADETDCATHWENVDKAEEILKAILK